MKRNAVGIVASALFAALVGNSAGAQTYSVMNLGLGGPPHSTGIAGINAQGQVAGTSLTATGEHAFFATQTDGNIDIGMAGSLRTQAGALNASGQIIGFAEIFDARGNRVDHAFSWTRDGGMIDLGTLGGLHSWATAVNDAGTVIGDSYLPDNLTTHAFMWTKTGGMVDLGSLGGNTQAYAINAQGQIVGYSRDTNGALQANDMNQRGFLAPAARDQAREWIGHGAHIGIKAKPGKLAGWRLPPSHASRRAVRGTFAKYSQEPARTAVQAHL